MTTATEQRERDMRPNLRRMRADSLAHHIFAGLEKFIPYEAQNDAHKALHECLFREGVEVLTDRLREAFKLPPRGPDGWTVDELVALEEARLERITSPPPLIYVDPKSTPAK